MTIQSSYKDSRYVTQTPPLTARAKVRGSALCQRPKIVPIDFVLLALLGLMTVVILGKDISVGGLRYGDTAVHAMDGVLVHDWIAAGPKAWLSPMDFAEQQYAHYPCLGIGRHYPPAFAVIEAGFFAVFGISAFSARLCVVFFGLTAVTGAYWFARKFCDRMVSVIAAATLIALPSVTFWGRQTMLELPTLSVLTWAAVTFLWYLRSPTWKRWGVLMVVAMSALLFRQTCVFLLGALAMTLSYCALRDFFNVESRVPALDAKNQRLSRAEQRGRTDAPMGALAQSLRRVVRPSHATCCVLLAIVAIMLVALSFEGAGARMMRGRATFPSLLHPRALTFYLEQLPTQAGWAVLVAAVVGLPCSFRKDRVLGGFLVCWFFVAYVMVTSAELKWTRFFFVGLFPLAIWAALGAERILAMFARTRVRTAIASLAVVGLCGRGLAQPVEHHPDYGAVVTVNKENIEGRVVLFSGLRDTHFVFSVRQHIPWRKAVVVRGSKLFYSCNTIPSVDFESYVSSIDDVEALIRRFAFASVFNERENKFQIKEDDLVTQFLSNSADYRHVAAYPLRVDEIPTYRDTTIDLYESALPIAREVDYFDIPIPRSKRTIRLDLTDWSS